MSNAPAGIDPRGPRFAASITTVLLAITIFFGLIGNSTATFGASFGWSDAGTFADGDFVLPHLTLVQRISDAGFILLVIAAALFAWGVISPKTAAWGVLFRKFVQPKLPKPTELEDPRPPRFAQGVGLFVVGIGVVLHLFGVPLAVPIAAGAAFIAAFLNAVFAFCLGCQIYLGLQRLRPREATA